MKLTENDLKYLQKPEGVWEWRRPLAGDRYRGYRRTIAGEMGITKQVPKDPFIASKRYHLLKGELDGYRWCAPKRTELTEEDMELVSVNGRGGFWEGYNPLREGELILSKKELDELKKKTCPSFAREGLVIISPKGKIKVSKNDLLNYGIAYLQTKTGCVSVEVEGEEKGVSDEEFEAMNKQLAKILGAK